MKCLILLAIIFKWILKITSLPKSLFLPKKNKIIETFKKEQQYTLFKAKISAQFYANKFFKNSNKFFCAAKHLKFFKAKAHKTSGRFIYYKLTFFSTVIKQIFFCCSHIFFGGNLGKV